MTNDIGLIELDNTDSTNNYAMQLVNDDKAHHGLTITAKSQHGGKGQRGRLWMDTPGESLLMSIIVVPNRPLAAQFTFSASVAVAIANVLQKLLPDCSVRIKWPNDIIINDKKAGGILIENSIHGSQWTHSVIGLGLNISQKELPAELPFATSLAAATNSEFEIGTVRDRIRTQILDTLSEPAPPTVVMATYNQYLYKKGKQQKFGDDNGFWLASIMGALPDGRLQVTLADGTPTAYLHGTVRWEWE